MANPEATTAAVPKKTKPKTRKGIEDQRQQWKEQKAAQRAKWSGQKKRWHRQRCLENYYSKKGQ